MSKPQIFCFTYAGGKAEFFSVIKNDLPEIELLAPDYPGHGTRHKEPLCSDFRELADDMFSFLMNNHSSEKYALFGYSMGAITLIEVLKRIISSGMPLPECVFLAAHEPHTKQELSGFDSAELDEKVKERTIAFGAVPERLIGNKSFWRMYLPLYRADYSMIGRYRFEELNFTVNVPAAVFYSETDTPLSDMTEWRNIFTGKCELYKFDGSHFFINEHHRKIAEIISSMLTPDRDPQ